MSNIQGPSNNGYPTNSYGPSSDYGSQGGNDPLAQYGMGNDQTQAYIDSMHRYQQMLQSYKKMYPNDSEMMATIDNYMATSQKYLQQVGDFSSAWDPMGGMLGGDFGQDGMGTDPMGGMGTQAGLGDLIWGTRNTARYDGDKANVTVNLNDPDKREKEFLQNDFTLSIPLHAKVSESLMTGDADSFENGQTLVITVTLPDGSQQVYKKLNFKESDNVRVLTLDGDDSQITKDASLSSSPLADVATVGKIGEDEGLDQAGDPPDDVDRKNKTRTWKKHDTVNYQTTEGKEKDIIYANTLNFNPPDRTYNTYVVKTGEHTYHIEVEDSNGKVVRTIDADQIHSLNINADADHVFFKDETKKASGTPITPGSSVGGLITKKKFSSAVISGLLKDIIAATPSTSAGDTTTATSPFKAAGRPGFKAWSDKAHDKDKQISVAGDDSGQGAGPGQPVNPNHPEDSSPSVVNGSTATYDTDSDPKITNYFDGGPEVKTFDVTASGTVTINPSKQSDHYKVTMQGDTYVITAYGKDEDGKEQQITYHVKASQVQGINLSGVGASQVDLSALTPDQKAKIQVSGTSSSAGNTIGDLPEPLKSFSNMVPGMDFTLLKYQLLFHFRDAFPADRTIDTLTIDDIKNACNAGALPPPVLNGDFISFLTSMDPKLKTALNAVAQDGKDNNNYRQAMKAVSLRLIDLLKAFYSGHNIQMTHPDGGNNEMNDISFDGKTFQAFEDPSDNWNSGPDFKWF